jgi:hypothetical protein
MRMTWLALVFGLLSAVVAGLTLLLNALHAGDGISVAVLGLVIGIGGGTIGYFSDRLPDFSRHR